MAIELLNQPQSKLADAHPRRTILIVDDDEALAEVLAYRLTQQGFETLSTGLGKRGLALARSERPDLIILDLRLPDVEGFTVCQELADSPRTCNIPVLILSGMERPDIVRRSRLAGCCYFVRKPYDPNALLVLIRQALAESENWGPT